jgi:hypothetical protein
MYSRVFSQLANGIVAALLLSACAQTGQDLPKAAAPTAPAVVATVPPPQPVLPILKPGTKKRAPAKPRLDLDVIDAATAAPLSPDTGGGNVSPGAAGANMPSGAVGDANVEVETGTTQIGSTVSPAYVPAEPEPVESASPDELRGQTEIQVMNVLGSPASTRAEGTGTIWIYRLDGCSLDVYFFLDVADNQRRALSYELTPANRAEARADERCYLALKNASAAR